MRVERLAENEARFRNGEGDSNGRKYNLIRKAIEIFGEDADMRYVEMRPENGEETYFYRVSHPKEQIVLHFTIGHLKGDVATLTKPNFHVSVPFLLARDGTTYNLFPSEYWSYHLGRAAVGGNTVRSRGSIGIELSNLGPLERSGEELLTIYSKPNRKDVYCDMDQREFYTAIGFRDYEFYATFTDAQYESLVVLLRYLTARYDIPRRFLPPAQRFETSNETPHFRGIVSHVNYRADKCDIGPAFDWPRVIDGLA